MSDVSGPERDALSVPESLRRIVMGALREAWRDDYSAASVATAVASAILKAGWRPPTEPTADPLQRWLDDAGYDTAKPTAEPVTTTETMRRLGYLAEPTAERAGDADDVAELVALSDANAEHPYTSGYLRGKAEGLRVARQPQPAAVPDHAAIDRLARILMAAWNKAEKTTVNGSYVATFADMARAALTETDEPPSLDALTGRGPTVPDHAETLRAAVAKLADEADGHASNPGWAEPSRYIWRGVARRLRAVLGDRLAADAGSPQ